MTAFDWNLAAATLENFGGEIVTLHIRKTGLPYFDTLQLYGAIDIYIGLREDVQIHDQGNEWRIEGRSRSSRLGGKDRAAFHAIWSKKKPQAEDYCDTLRQAIVSGKWAGHSYELDGRGEWDAVLQAGIRGLAAEEYETLQSGQTSKTACKARVPLAQGMLAFAGRRRTERVGEITFLPVFEGSIDLSKVVSPLRAWVGVPNVLCAQVLALLALKASLFDEGYQDRLTAVAFNTNFSGQRSDNYSGLSAIASTAIGQMKSSGLVARTYAVFRGLVANAWRRQGRAYQAQDLAPHALAMAQWLMQPAGKHLGAMISSQERLYRSGRQQLFVTAGDVKEIIEMSYGDWQGDHEAVRKFAKAVASGIYYTRMKQQQSFDDQRKAWYDEVAVLRSSPSAKVFIERAMLLIEQGHREQSQVGTTHRDEAFDPEALMRAFGGDRTGDRASFETFRDLFRMYLVQESTYQVTPVVSTGASIESSDDNPAVEIESEDDA